MSLKVDLTLPPGALLGQADRALEQAMSPTGATWLQAQPDWLDRSAETGAITSWRPRVGSVNAVPTKPNVGSSFHVPEGIALEQGTHCGFIADQITPDAARFTMAITYLPVETKDAKTLLTLNPRLKNERSQNYIYLSESNGSVTVSDDHGLMKIEQPVAKSPDKPRLLVVSLSGPTLALYTPETGTVQTRNVAPGMGKAASLFIGCRSQREGLKNTLGTSILRDVFFWPRHSLLLPRIDEDDAQMTALTQFFRWTA